MCSDCKSCDCRFPGCRVTRYTREGKVFKYAVLAPNTREAVRWLTELDEEAYQLYQEGRLLTVVDSKAGKKNGLITLCARLGISLREVLVVGNTMHDWPMMSVAGYSCAVMDAEEKLRKLSGYVLNPDSIPVFLISDFIWPRCSQACRRYRLLGCRPG